MCKTPCRLLVACCVIFSGSPAWCAGEDAPAGDEPAGRWALIVAGLPGDAEHEALFQKTAKAWGGWLTKKLGFPQEQVVFYASAGPVAGASAGAPSAAATEESLEAAIGRLAGRLTAEDELWVFFLGHGNYDGERAFFHVRGRDPDAASLARWLDAVPSRRQVVWLTHSSSGWFVKPLSKPGRVVIAATATDAEENETEFPHALAAVAARTPDALDGNGDGQVSLLEVFLAAAREVESIFAADKRLATEHAQLDDNGDGKGSEAPDLQALAAPAANAPQAKAADEAPAPPAARSGDGAVAAQYYLPYRRPAGAASKSPGPESPGPENPGPGSPPP